MGQARSAGVRGRQRRRARAGGRVAVQRPGPPLGRTAASIVRRSLPHTATPLVACPAIHRTGGCPTSCGTSECNSRLNVCGVSPRTVPVVSEGQPDPLLPSLDVVRSELDREQESHERRAGQVDTKAGLILAASGIVVALPADEPALLSVLAQVAAAVAGGLAVFAFLPRVAGTLSPLELRKRYVHRPEQVTKLVVLDTRLIVHADDERQLKTKADRLKLAVTSLGLAVALALAGSILDYAGGGSPREQPRPDSPQPGASSPSQSGGGPSVPARS